MSNRLPADVAEIFAAYPSKVRSRLVALRKLILDTAAANPDVGPLTETLKWGEVAYLTEETRSGTTVRIAWKASAPETYAMYVHCQTNLVDTFRTRFPELTYEGNRAVVFKIDDPLDKAAAAGCIDMALTYHLAKRGRRRA